MRVVSSEALAWLGWLLTLSSSIGTKAAGLNASEWAAWVQAVFSLVAIAVVIWQNWTEKRRRERERDDRAQVVAARLSVWLGEIGGRIDLSLMQLESLRGTDRLLHPLERLGLKLNVVGRIDDTMSDLHYLRAGSADIAQLAYFANFFDAFVDNQTAAIIARSAGSLGASQSDLTEFYSAVENQLKNMKQLHTNTERHISPLIDVAIEQER
jgi:hypothetical protein